MTSSSVGPFYGEKMKTLISVALQEPREIKQACMDGAGEGVLHLPR